MNKSMIVAVALMNLATMLVSAKADSEPREVTAVAKMDSRTSDPERDPEG